MILSILIPTIPDRSQMFSRLYTEVMNQVTYLRTVHPTIAGIEVLIDDTKRFLDGGQSIGMKRNSLVLRATGKYLCFLDDDESISPNYVETLARLCAEDKDVCTFRNITKLFNYWMVVDMSLSNPINEDAMPGIIKRRPWHICPVRTEYAQLHEFQNSNYGEDWQWFERVLAHCKTEAHSEYIIHQYNHGKHSEADKITNHVQSESGRKNNP